MCALCGSPAVVLRSVSGSGPPDVGPTVGPICGSSVLILVSVEVVRLIPRIHWRAAVNGSRGGS